MKVSALTSSLLVRKGDATPSTFVPRGPVDARPAPSVPPSSGSSAIRPNGTPHLRVVNNVARIRISVRLDPDRHRALKLIAAHTGRSVQDLTVAALDEYLDSLGGEVRDGQCLCLNDEAAPGMRSHED
jgi:hypothetical protein